MGDVLKETVKDFFEDDSFSYASSITNSSVNPAYGVAGSLVIILLWVYYSTVIFLFGAELMYVYAKAQSAAVQPYSNAVKVRLVKVEKT